MSCKYIKDFKEKPFEERLEMSSGVLKKYKDRCPIIIGKKDNTDLMDLDKHKFLTPRSSTLAEFSYVIKKRITLNDIESYFIFFNNKIYSQDTLLSTIYEENKDKDGFLYAVYCIENTFGNISIQ